MYNPPIEDFYFLKIKNMWRYFRGQHFSFWMICFYLFFEYTRPQSIFPAIAFLPWSQLFIIGALLGAITDRTVKWVSSPVNPFLIWFALVIFISIQFASYPEISREHYIDFYSWFVIYFLIITIVNTKQRFYIFLIIFILCAAKISIGTSKIWAFRGFAFSKWGLVGPNGYFNNSGELAILMLTLFPLAYLLYEHLKNKVGLLERVLLIIFWVTPVLTILGASSRGAQVALVVQLLILFRKKIFKFKALIGMVLLVSVSYHLLPEEQKERFESAGGDNTSVQRLLYWKHGANMMMEYPFLGVGYFNFAPYYADHHSYDLLSETAQLPHNIMIQIGTDVGIAGLIPFIALLSLPFILSLRAIRQKGKDSFIVISITGTAYGLLGFIVAGQFVTVAYYPFLWIGLAFIVVAGYNILNVDGKASVKKRIGCY